MNNIFLLITVFVIILISLFIGCNQSKKSNSLQRDYSKFPSDENGDALYNLFLQGIDLNNISNIEYAVVFPQKGGAIKFTDSCKAFGLSTIFEEYEEQTDFKYGVIVTKSMIPTYSNITENEIKLGNIAEVFDGKNDGWGFFAQKK